MSTWRARRPRAIRHGHRRPDEHQRVRGRGARMSISGPDEHQEHQEVGRMSISGPDEHRRRSGGRMSGHMSIGALLGNYAQALGISGARNMLLVSAQQLNKTCQPCHRRCGPAFKESKVTKCRVTTVTKISLLLVDFLTSVCCRLAVCSLPQLSEFEHQPREEHEASNKNQEHAQPRRGASHFLHSMLLLRMALRRVQVKHHFLQLRLQRADLGLQLRPLGL